MLFNSARMGGLLRIYKKTSQIKNEKLIDFIWQNGYNNDRKDK